MASNVLIKADRCTSKIKKNLILVNLLRSLSKVLSQKHVFFSSLVLGRVISRTFLNLNTCLVFPDLLQTTGFYYTSGDIKANKTNSQEYHTVQNQLQQQDFELKTLHTRIWGQMEVSAYITAEPTTCCTLRCNQQRLWSVPRSSEVIKKEVCIFLPTKWNSLEESSTCN